jgi:hypothetical protein
MRVANKTPSHPVIIQNQKTCTQARLTVCLAPMGSWYVENWQIGFWVSEPCLVESQKNYLARK